MKKYNYISLIHQFYKELKIAKSKKEPLRPLIRKFPDYIRENRIRLSRLDDGIPWLSKSAVSFLNTNINSINRVFEYGSGASTIYFANKGVKLVSIEHNREWFEIVKKRIEGFSKNIELKLYEPKISLNNSSITSYKDTDYKGYDYTEYSQAILQYPDNYFDLILIDGRVRLECLKNSMNKLKKFGILIFDNSDRYQINLDTSIFQCILENYDLVSNDLFFSKTSVFKKVK